MVNIDLLGANPKIKVEKIDIVTGKFIVLNFDNIAIDLDRADFEYLLEQCMEVI